MILSNILKQPTWGECADWEEGAVASQLRPVRNLEMQAGGRLARAVPARQGRCTCFGKDWEVSEDLGAWGVVERSNLGFSRVHLLAVR